MLEAEGQPLHPQDCFIQAHARRLRTTSGSATVELPRQPCQIRGAKREKQAAVYPSWARFGGAHPQRTRRSEMIDNTRSLLPRQIESILCMDVVTLCLTLLQNIHLPCAFFVRRALDYTALQSSACIVIIKRQPARSRPTRWAACCFRRFHTLGTGV